ncbi:Ferredoxin-fold anticodon binding domain-containing protein [Besnoitia besnoiti]|uniref:phenylalanine--tRNA ligase n=1 Tax=Besnoitia besnoiti TaxID=94643 RepID=A0A2A9M507_BESBE|nr:Ferredoxin-fold anticodon binding domain-containing protein [Besnoitia besnoiti]PFH32294.1 Ferredoxin-fold anticodon binding domain-containing protein [Besnoitia besnoiti]
MGLHRQALVGQGGWHNSLRSSSLPLTRPLRLNPVRTQPKPAERSPSTIVLLASLCACAVDHKASNCQLCGKPPLFWPAALSSFLLRPSASRAARTRTLFLTPPKTNQLRAVQSFMNLSSAVRTSTPRRRALPHTNSPNELRCRFPNTEWHPSSSRRFMSSSTALESHKVREASERSAIAANRERPGHIPPSVWDKLDRHLHRRADNPIGILKSRIESFFLSENKALLRETIAQGGTSDSLLFPEGLWQEASTRFQEVQDPLHWLQRGADGSSGCTASATTLCPLAQRPSDAPVDAARTEATAGHEISGFSALSPFQLFDDFSPFVTCRQNFDSLLVPMDHVSRLPSDTYYVDDIRLASGETINNTSSSSVDGYDPDRVLLRTHCTAHQKELIDAGVEAAVWTAEVIRRDEIDRLHYPVFHQTDGFRVFSKPQMKRLEAEHQLLLKVVANVRGNGGGDNTAQSPPTHKKPGGATAKDKLERWILQSPCLFPSNPFLKNPLMIHLQLTLEKLLRHLLGSDVRLKWDYETSFPFTSPSVELYVARDPAGSVQAAGQAEKATEQDTEDDWMEVLGAGEIRSEILRGVPLPPSSKSENDDRSVTADNAGESSEAVAARPTIRGWAFGLGLERLCMHLFGIEDIRLFWSEDERFSEQFADGQVRRFVPFSIMPPVYKDISFWVNEAIQTGWADCSKAGLPASEACGLRPARLSLSAAQGQTNTGTSDTNSAREPGQPPRHREKFTELSFYELCRESGGDLVESVKLVDSFVHPKTGRKSLCYRLTYRAIDRTLTHEEVNAIQEAVYNRTGEAFDVDLR